MGELKPTSEFDADRLDQVIDGYLEDYEMVGEAEDGRDACHVPTEGERILIKDAILGLLSNEEWDAEWGKLIEQRARSLLESGESAASGAKAWAHREDETRVISAAQKAQALRDGGASASSVAPYSVALVSASSAMGDDGWRLVPVEPTEEMIQIGKHAHPYRAVDVYRAMVAASPSPSNEREGK